MQVNVFIIRRDTGKDAFFVMPADRPIAIPPQVRKGWEFYGIVDSTDRMFQAAPLEDQIAEYGYCLVPMPKKQPSVFAKFTNGHRLRHLLSVFR